MPKKRTRRTVESRLRTELTVCKDAYQRQTIHMEQLLEQIRQHTETWAHRDRELKAAEMRLSGTTAALQLAYADLDKVRAKLSERDKQIAATQETADWYQNELKQHGDRRSLDDEHIKGLQKSNDELVKRSATLMKAYSHLSRAHHELLMYYTGAVMLFTVPE